MKIATFKTGSITQIIQDNILQMCYSYQQKNLVFSSRDSVCITPFPSGVASRTLSPGHQDTTPKHESRRCARAKAGTSYSARGTGACPKEDFETLVYLKWNFQHLEKAKYLISQFAKKGRHDKNYRLPVGQSLFFNKCQKAFTKLSQNLSRLLL